MIEFTYLKQPARKYTFEMRKLKNWTIQNCKGKVLNLFAGKTLLKGVDETRVDLQDYMPAHYHMDALAFVLMAKEKGMMFDTVIFDPPYNLRKSREKYMGIYTSELRRIKTELPNIMNMGGTIICYGYDTTGMGRQRGFELIKICIVNHSGDHNDTLCTIEKKIQSSLFGGEEKILIKVETKCSIEA